MATKKSAVPNSSQEVTTKQEEKPEFARSIRSKDPWEAHRIRDRKPVTGIFRFMENPGGVLNFSFRKYKGDPVESFSLVDGETYTLPLGVAKHLRNSGWYPVHAYTIENSKDMKEMGTVNKKISRKVHRYNFEPLEFIADEELNNPYSQKDKEIITVQT